MKIIRIVILISIIQLLCFSFVFSVIAHPGRTDSNGGHWNHSTGEYHYHTGEYAGRSSTSNSKSSSSNAALEEWIEKYNKVSSDKLKSSKQTKSSKDEAKSNTLSLFADICGVLATMLLVLPLLFYTTTLLFCFVSWLIDFLKELFNRR